MKSIALFWRRIRVARVAAIEYVDCFGLARGLLLLAVRAVWPPEKGRTVRVKVPGHAVSVLIRVGTTDIAVFNSTFRSQQYSYELPRPLKVILDAGAYTGLSSVYFATKYPGATIIAVEPDTRNFALLLRNTSQFSNIYPVHAALWPKNGFLTLADPGEAWAFRITGVSGDAGDAVALPGTSGAGTSVPAVTVPDIMARYGLPGIDLLKLDIEGSEKELFADAGPWLGRVGAICIELHDRFKPGCSREFYKAVADFPKELRRGETVMVMR